MTICPPPSRMSPSGLFYLMLFPELLHLSAFVSPLIHKQTAEFLECERVCGSDASLCMYRAPLKAACASTSCSSASRRGRFPLGGAALVEPPAGTEEFNATDASPSCGRAKVGAAFEQECSSTARRKSQTCAPSGPNTISSLTARLKVQV